MEKALVSIIVPIYNVEKYLRRNLDSLTSQTYPNIEIIGVNDGSSDNSGAILAEYAHKYSNIVCINQENGGLSQARNSGLRKAQGDYIFFVDSDDYISEDCVEKLCKAMDEGYDMVEPLMELVYDDAPNAPYNYILPSNIEHLSLQNSGKNQLKIVMNVNGKMYRKEILKDLAFPKGLLHEDVYYTAMLLPRFKSVKKADEGTFYYYMRSNSIMNTINNRAFEMFDIMKLIHDEYQAKHYDMLVAERIFVRNLLFAIVFKRCAYMTDHEYRSRKVLEIFDYFKQVYPNYLKNPYITIKEKMLVTYYISNFKALEKRWERGKR